MISYGLPVQTPPTTLVDLARLAARTHPERGYRFLRGGLVTESLSYAELDLAAQEIASSLARAGVRPGDRALLVYDSGLEFIRAFWGCLYAGVIAVPAPPVNPARVGRTLPRLLAIARDCRPRVLLSRAKLTATLPPEVGTPVVATDLGCTQNDGWTPPNLDGDQVALLQYTSGSTREPRGVILSHANVLHNLSLLAQFHRHPTAMVMVHWLPHFHDMGLIRGILAPLASCGDCIMLDALEFVQRPLRWLNALSKFQATITGAPNFGYALTERKVEPASLLGLDLSRLEVAFCSAEPIVGSTLRKFAQLLAPTGFRRQALKPAYGLAEATVMVSGEMTEEYSSRWVSRAAMGGGRVASPDNAADSVELVCCGTTSESTTLLIVDSHGVPCPTEVIGEIWLRGPSVGQGYWDDPSQTEQVFEGRLSSGEGPFLRTGDLGWIDARGLTVCGRIKDLMIVRGQNFYPHDLEACLSENVPGLRAGCCAVFTTEEGDLVVVAEALEAADVAPAVIAAVSEEFGLSVKEVLLLFPNSLPKTASGKVQRAATRRLHLEAGLNPRHHWKAPVRS